MDAYIYNGALLCENCAEDIMHEHPFTVNDWRKNDSDHYPQGPYSNGGGESDSPAHCDTCFVFLENPLTSDGIEYVRKMIARDPQGSVAQEWAEFYKDVLC